MRVTVSTVRKLGTSVRDVRQKAGLSQADLASLAGVSRTVVVGLEAGTGNPTLQLLLRLSAVLQCEFVIAGGARPEAPLPRLRRVTAERKVPARVRTPVKPPAKQVKQLRTTPRAAIDLDRLTDGGATVR
jgi:transcriptional regulator with XRE-family HTH domain